MLRSSLHLQPQQSEMLEESLRSKLKHISNCSRLSPSHCAGIQSLCKETRAGLLSLKIQQRNTVSEYAVFRDTVQALPSIGEETGFQTEKEATLAQRAVGVRCRRRTPASGPRSPHHSVHSP